MNDFESEEEAIDYYKRMADYEAEQQEEENEAY